MSDSIILVQTSMADFREKFARGLSARLAPDFGIVVGSEYFEDTIRTSEAVKALTNVTLIDNHFLLDRKICIQGLNWQSIRSAKIVILELNPRILSNWLILLLRKLSGKKTILWGHAWSRSGPESRTEWLRHQMRRLASGLIFYTQSQRDAFLSRYSSYPSERTFVAPNSLYRSDEIQAAPVHGQDFIYVGRLVAGKKVALLIEGFAKFLELNDTSATLHMVGDGTEKAQLEARVKALGISDRVVFYGHVSDMEKLNPIYSQSLCSISPGYIGLSVTQSFCFGRPMLIARDEPHSPEIEAVEDGFNAQFFASDSAEALGAAMHSMHQQAEVWASRYGAIAQRCREQYSIEAMVAGFISALED